MKIRSSKLKEMIKEELIEEVKKIDAESCFKICNAQLGKGRSDKKFSDCAEECKEQHGIPFEEKKSLNQDLYNCQKNSKEKKCKNNPFGGHTGVSGQSSLEEALPPEVLTTEKGDDEKKINMDDAAERMKVEQGYQEEQFNSCGRCKFGNVPVNPTMCDYKLNFPIKPDGTCNKFSKR